MIRRPPRSPLFPSPPLFRSGQAVVLDGAGRESRVLPVGADRRRIRGARDHRLTRVLVRLARDRGPPRRVHHGDALGDRLEADRKSTRLNSSHSQISYAVFCLKKKNNKTHSSTISYILLLLRQY